MEVNINPVSGVPGESYNYVDRWMANPLILFIVLVVILMYYTLSHMLAAASAQRPVMEVVFLEVLLWGTFLTIVLMNALRYFYGANIVAKISKLFSQEPQVDITVTTTDDAAGAPVPELTHSKQVFHVPGNHYTFDDAKAVCVLRMEEKLASYNQMEDAYEDGADWCSYGWSEDQMAFFPTQEEKWKKLQKIEGHKHDCGRPGINGGYIANPNVKFGVNCYGYKPDITPYESQLMRESTGLPTTKKDQEFQKLVKEEEEDSPDTHFSFQQERVEPLSKNIKSLPTVCYLCCYYCLTHLDSLPCVPCFP